MRQGNKEAAMAALRTKCKSLVAEVYSASGKVVVFGEGNLDASVVLVGEAPGEQETLQGKPFVGKAGKNLDAFLEKLSLKREDIYITNVVKFRPVKVHPRTGSLSNRPPSREEIGLCFAFLLGELEIIQPKVVVTLGNVALKAVADDGRAVIGAWHGKPVELEVHKLKFTIFPLYHPASIIYNRDLGDTYDEDLVALRRYLEAPVL